MVWKRKKDVPPDPDGLDKQLLPKDLLPDLVRAESVSKRILEQVKLAPRSHGPPTDFGRGPPNPGPPATFAVMSTGMFYGTASWDVSFNGTTTPDRREDIFRRSKGV